MSSPDDKKVIPLWYLAGTVGVVGSSMYFGLVFLVTKYAYRLNVIFGLFCSIDLALAGILFIGAGYQYIREAYPAPGKSEKQYLLPFLARFTKHDFVVAEKQDRQFVISYFTPIVAFFLESWTSLAYGFARLSPAAYAHPERLSYWLMFEHYLWQTIDMVPLINAWKIIHIEDPLPETRLWPGVLVLVFRIVILYFVVAAASNLFGFAKRNAQTE